MVDSKTVCVKWKAPQHAHHKVTSYVVRYAPDRNWPLESWFSVTVNASAPTKVSLVVLDKKINQVG